MAESFSALLRRRLLPEQGSAHAREAAARLAELVGDRLAGVIFFGSRKSDAGFNPHSAHDFFVVTRGYRGFYERLHERGRVRRSPRLLAALNAVMPPNQLRLTADTAVGAVTMKCAVIDLEAFERQTSWRRSDHFCLGRLFQPVEIVHAADAPMRDRLVAAVESAHRLTYRWGRPWLAPEFDAAGYYRTLLRVSMSGEIRPESSGRAESLWEAQRSHRRGVYPVLLAELAARGELVRQEAGRYRLTRPAGALERLRLRGYFAWSKLRATTRWAKYMVTFDDWLDYIVLKVERHTGRRIEVTPRQRRYPLLLLWPALLRHLREKEKRP